MPFNIPVPIVPANVLPQPYPQQNAIALGFPAQPYPLQNANGIYVQPVIPPPPPYDALDYANGIDGQVANQEGNIQGKPYKLQ